MAIGFGLSYAAKYMQPVASFFMIYVSKILLTFICFLAICVFVKFFYVNAMRQLKPSVLKFVIELILYIPCKFNDILQYVFNEFKMTHPYVYYILIVEIALILLYFLIPVIFKHVVSIPGAKKLLGEPTYLQPQQAQIIATDSDLNGEQAVVDLTTNQRYFNKHYGFSLWVNLNPQTFPDKRYEISIFAYGNKPKLVYSFNEKTKKDVYRIYYSGKDATTTGGSNQAFFEVSLPNQKWNHFFFNYFGSYMNCHINGELVKSVEFGSLPPTYNVSDKVIIGNDDVPFSVLGAIASVVYFNKNLPPEEITNLYNLGKLTAPYPGNLS